jgi:hypothetical protein
MSRLLTISLVASAVFVLTGHCQAGSPPELVLAIPMPGITGKFRPI